MPSTGIVEEASSILEDFGDTAAGDAAIIFAAQAAEHYEITRYGSLRAFAEVLKYDKATSIITSILDQEKAADQKLTEIAEERIDYAAAGMVAAMGAADDADVDGGSVAFGKKR